MADAPANWPNPGSQLAIERGCICPVLDNNRGRYAPYPPNGWWMTAGCPLHTDNPTSATFKAADSYPEGGET